MNVLGINAYHADVSAVVLADRGLGARPAALYLLIILGIAARLCVIFAIGLVQEDALITLRYARNLWSGIGFVYNRSEYILAATSPLWTILTSPLVGLVSYSIASKLIALLGVVLFGWAEIISLWLTSVSSFSFTSRFLLLGILSLHPTLVAFSVSGMEAPLFFLLIVGSLYALRGRRFIASSVLTGLAVLTRPEGVIWFACLGVYFALSQRRLPWRESAAIILIVAPWVGFACVYFGSAIPQSAIAKTNWLSEPITLVDFLWRPASLFDKWVGFGGIRFPSLPTFIQIVVAAIWSALFVAGVVMARRHRDDVILLLAGFFVTYVSFYYLGNARVFEWYSVPGVASASFVVALSVGTASDATLDRISRRHAGSGTVYFCRAMVLGSVLVSLSGLLTYKMSGFKSNQSYENTVRRPLGEYLAECSHSEATVMLEPIGYIGYFSDRRIIDLAGLVTPSVASIRQKGIPGWVVEEIQAVYPSHIVLRAYEVPTNTFFASSHRAMFASEKEKEWFTAHYIVEKVFGEAEDAMVIYRRADLGSRCRRGGGSAPPG